MNESQEMRMSRFDGSSSKGTRKKFDDFMNRRTVFKNYPLLLTIVVEVEEKTAHDANITVDVCEFYNYSQWERTFNSKRKEKNQEV